LPSPRSRIFRGMPPRIGPIHFKGPLWSRRRYVRQAAFDVLQEGLQIVAVDARRNVVGVNMVLFRTSGI